MQYELTKKEKPTKCVGYSMHLKMPEEREKIFDLWAKFNRDRHKIPFALGTSFGISEFSGDLVKYSAMMEVSEFGATPEGMTTMTVAPCSYAQFTHEGTVQEVGKTCEEIYTELPKTDLKAQGPLIEVYSPDFKGQGREKVPLLVSLQGN